MQHNINTAGTVLTVSDGGWTASVRTLGAELQSVRDPQGHEYIWQGDPAVWSGRSPLLFPIVGRQKDDTLDYGNGTEYKMKAHGFAKTQIFSVASRTEREAELILYDNEATRSQYFTALRVFAFLQRADCAADGAKHGRPAAAVPFGRAHRLLRSDGGGSDLF